jgi:hypothetical protein
MASPNALRDLIEALEAEQARRQAARFGGQDPRQWFLDELRVMAERFAATAHRYPLSIDDMAPAELLACHFLAEHLRPPGLPGVDEIWATFDARK